MSKFYETDSETRWWAGIFGRVLAFAGLIMAIVLVIAALKYVTADARGKADVRERTRADGSYRIAAYEEFYDLCNAVIAKEQQIQFVQSDQSAPPAQKSANLLALKNSRASLIAKYNSQASKADTRGHFQASDLPYKLDETSEKTTCAAS